MEGENTLPSLILRIMMKKMSMRYNLIFNQYYNRFELDGIYYKEGRKLTFTTFIFLVESLACNAY